MFLLEWQASYTAQMEKASVFCFVFHVVFLCAAQSGLVLRLCCYLDGKVSVCQKLPSSNLQSFLHLIPERVSALQLFAEPDVSKKKVQQQQHRSGESR